MLCCIVCSKQGEPSVETVDGGGITRSPAVKEGNRSISAQVKEIAVRLAYRHCRPCSSSAIHQREESYIGSLDVTDAASEIAPSKSLPLSHFLSSYNFPPMVIARHIRNNGNPGVALKSPEQTRSSSNATPTTIQELPILEELEQEWVAQVEPGVLITLVALADGGNALKRIRFSRAIFNRWQAQQWWAVNCEKVHELYNVSLYNRSTESLPGPSRSEPELKASSERECGMLSAHECPQRHCRNRENLSNGTNSGAREQSSLGNSGGASQCEHEGLACNTSRTSSSCQATNSDMDAERPEDLKSSGEAISISNSSDEEVEWVEEDDPGVYITIRSTPGGIRELKRVIFSREKFTEVEARIWWEENRGRIREQYL